MMAWAGRGIYASAARGLRHGTTNMNTLVSLGTGVAFRLFRLCNDLARARKPGLL
jgi:cation transport ATPase